MIRPKVMLLDEPLGALDLKLRQELQVEIKRVQQTLGITTLFVTHDQGEALSLSDRVVVMRDGGVLQVDTPQNLYRRPLTRAIADFIGRMNFFPATVLGSEADGSRHVLQLDDVGGVEALVVGPQGRRFQPGERCLLGVRPEDFQLDVGEASPGANLLPAEAAFASYSGSIWTVTCRTAGTASGEVQIVVPATQTVPTLPARVTLRWQPDRCVVLDHE